MAGVDCKVEAASTKRSFHPINDLLTYIRKEKVRRSDLVVEYGAFLLSKYSSRLGNDRMLRRSLTLFS